jgi:hypothetical protein
MHRMYGDGSKSSDGSAFGAWLVMSPGIGKETYFNGPTHFDLTVDGIVYNALVSNHHGNGVPEMTNGFDRTFGPVSNHVILVWYLVSLLSNTTTSTKVLKVLPCSSYAVMLQRLPPATGHPYMTQSRNTSRILFHRQVVVYSRVQLAFLRAQPALLPRWLSTTTTFKTTTKTAMPISTGPTLMPLVALRSPRSKLARIA